MITIHIDINVEGNAGGVTFTPSLRGDTPGEKQTLRQEHAAYAKDVETRLAAFVRMLGSGEEEGV